MNSPINSYHRLIVKSFLIELKIQISMALCRFKNIMCFEGNGAVRLLISLGSLTWFVLLIDPVYLFSNSRTTYLVMRYIANEETWALSFLISGIIGIFTVLFGIQNRFLLVLDAFLASLLWTTSTLACFAAHWPIIPISDFLGQLRSYAPPAAMSGEAWLSIASWWCLMRRLTDETHDLVFDNDSLTEEERFLR